MSFQGAALYPKFQPITAAGGTFTIDADAFESPTVFYGSATLVANVAIPFPANPTGKVPVMAVAQLNMTLTLNGNTMTVFGKKLSQQQALKGDSFAIAVYDSTNAKWDGYIVDSTSNKPPTYEGVGVNTLTNAGGTITLLQGVSKDWQTFVGSATLGADYTITATTPTDYITFFIKYSATMTVGAFGISFFGTALTATQALNGDTFIIARYDVANAAWVVRFIDGNLPLWDDQLVVVDIDFGSGYNAATNYNDIEIPYKYAIKKISGISLSNMAASGTNVITASIGGVAVTGGVITIPAGDTQGTATPTATPSALNTGAANTKIRLLGQNATMNSGKARLSVILTRKA